MNKETIWKMKAEIVERFTDRDGYLTDDLCERYDFEYEDIEELTALWIADLLAFELIMEMIGVDFNFGLAYGYGIEYLEGLERDWNE